MFTPPKSHIDAGLSDAITNLIDITLVTKTRAEYAAGRGSGEGVVAAKRIGSGYIGVECDRALAYKFHKQPKEERDSSVSPGELQRHAESGFWTETKTAEWFRWAGFDLHTHREDGRQFGWMDAPHPETGQLQMAGEVDGIIYAVPALKSLSMIQAPLIWESKKATAKKFAGFVKKGVKGADPKYFGQLQINMGYMEIGQTLFSMLNLDTMAYYHELVRFDQFEAQKLVDRAARVLKSEVPEELPRVTHDKADFRCRFCDYAGTCWK